MRNSHIVIVVWDDAHGSAHREVTEDDMPHRPLVMQTIGWLLRQDELGISIANEYCSDAESACYRGHTFVPIGLIRSVTPFTLSTPRKPRAKTSSVPSGSDG